MVMIIRLPIETWLMFCHTYFLVSVVAVDAGAGCGVVLLLLVSAKLKNRFHKASTESYTHTETHTRSASFHTLFFFLFQFNIPKYAGVDCFPPEYYVNTRFFLFIPSFFYSSSRHWCALFSFLFLRFFLCRFRSENESIIIIFSGKIGVHNDRFDCFTQNIFD